jgi:hypothetical protein
MIVQTDKPGFIKNTNNGSILNTDSHSLAAYKKMKAKDKQINNLQEKIVQMEAMLEKILRNLDLNDCQHSK